MNITEQVSEFIAGAGYEDLTQEAIDRAKVRLLDTMGVIAAGVNGPGCDAMLNIIKRDGGYEGASVIGYGFKAPTASAAMMNSLTMRSYDFEAIEAEGEGKTSSAAHISVTTMPVALAVADDLGANGKDFLTALVLGDDLTSRLGAASGFDVYAGWDNCGTMNAIGGAAIASKLMGLSPDGIDQALGLVENTLSGVIDNINDKSLSFKLNNSLAARNAVFCAEMSKNGFTAMRDGIGGAHGYFNRYCGDPKPDVLLKDLGKVYYADCVIKAYSACRATHPSITACEDLRNENNLDPASIAKVKIKATPRTCAGFVGEQPFVIAATPQVSGAFSIVFTAANMLLRGQVRPEDMNREKMEEPALQELLGKIELVPELPPNEYQTSEVEVTLTDGTVLYKRCDVPVGDIYKRPMSYEQIVDKYYKNIAFGNLVSKDNADKARAMIESAEDITCMRDLIGLFA